MDFQCCLRIINNALAEWQPLSAAAVEPGNEARTSRTSKKQDGGKKPEAGKKKASARMSGGLARGPRRPAILRSGS